MQQPWHTVDWTLRLSIAVIELCSKRTANLCMQAKTTYGNIVSVIPKAPISSPRTTNRGFGHSAGGTQITLSAEPKEGRALSMQI
jgi:hypothetical protein